MRAWACIVLLAGAMAAPACGQAPYVGASEADNEFHRITAADMQVIRGKRVLYGSRSFGLCVLSGLKRLRGQDPIYALDLSPSYIVNGRGPAGLPLDAPAQKVDRSGQINEADVKLVQKHVGQSLP